MYNNVLEPNEYPRHFLSDHNMSCSFAMDDGGRCLLDVINDPKLLQSFLESGSDENSKMLKHFDFKPPHKIFPHESY
ncbi:hypothetical protein JTE90_027714 [Oedothorax gibbosus]|uniref:Uncharacterized protein n=1 Tax=Oedothorax gibbosus TaxID=931172 RepID=A0AAV6UW94_9ARAC|nr:hypothetical protein JTE90_027714 [Oedothorax gibbosus]